MTRRTTTVLATVGLLAVAACGSSKHASTVGSSAPTGAAATLTSSGGACDFTASDDSSGDKPAPGLPPQPATPAPTTMTIQLTAVTQGMLTITFDPKAPCTIASFAHLAGKGYFDGTRCHRLTTAGIYVLQCGDPTGTGSGGPGYTIPDENLGAQDLPAGTVAMANTGRAHTGGSQFFICYKDTQLPPQYTPFGTVTAGLDLITADAAKGEDDANGSGDGAPKTPVTFTKVTVQ